MLRVAITGGLSTGKSTVTALLAQLGVPTISADEVGHRMLARGTTCYDKVVSSFGEGILSRDGNIDRALLGAVVFADTRKRRLLESLLHPAIWEEIEEWCRQHSERGACLVAMEVPLLFEAKLEQAVDEIWLVVCNPDLQLSRAIARGMTHEEAQTRIGAQMPLAEKARYAHRVIDTGGSPDATYAQVRKALESICVHKAPE